MLNLGRAKQVKCGKENTIIVDGLGKKEEIENLNLPGIDFIQDYKRYYPYSEYIY